MCPSAMQSCAALVLALALGWAVVAAEPPREFPIDRLPPSIRQVTTFGERADWSHDGQRILFLEKTFGDVYELDLASGKLKPLTHHYFHEGYTRALYLANGDILLSGARQFDAAEPWPSRDEKNAELWVLRHDLSGPPKPLGEHCSEGPAVSRKAMRIAWTVGGAIYTAEIVDDAGMPGSPTNKRCSRRATCRFAAVWKPRASARRKSAS